MDTDTSISGGANKKSRTWAWVVAIIIVLIVIGGIVAFLAHNSNKNTSPGSSNSSLPNKPFIAATNTNQPLSATITTSVPGGSNSANLLSDGKGNFAYSIKLKSEKGTTSTSTVYTPGAFYICNSASPPCLKYTTNNVNLSGNDPTGYIYDAAKLEKIKKNAQYKGRQPCPGGNGTCDVWSAPQGMAGIPFTYYVNTADKKIMKVSYDLSGAKNDITYDYKKVQITVPTNYKDASTKSLE